MLFIQWHRRTPYDLLRATSEIARQPMSTGELIGPEMVAEDVIVTVR